ncbi:MAG: hypothetical protein A2583_00120 [Bdellovibrionales bacterium RIFOXYD1_FULL_53_11]|nr:MAG: hypothetical protein A2583_00120 [Bdellovibrionales bacterium RIFOXYD1_FULL_53_11]
MIEKNALLEIIEEQHSEWIDKREALIPRNVEHGTSITSSHAAVITGIRRCGKSTLLRQFAQDKERDYYFRFEDERLIDFNAQDFQLLYDVFLEKFGIQRIFWFDEIQVVEKWELFVRRMMDKGMKFFLTGSNASLLSRELGTKLTGRHRNTTLYPFSFAEYLRFVKIDVSKSFFNKPEERAGINRAFNYYLHNGGMPEYIKERDIELLRSVYDDILYRDIAVRHDLGNIRLLREIGHQLISQIACSVSFNKMKDRFSLGSVNTLKKYIGYFEDCYLFFALNCFSPSLKKQLVLPKKIYCMDNGFHQALGFGVINQEGRLLENLVAVELKRRNAELYWYKTKTDREVDFLVRKGVTPSSLIQVCYSIRDVETRKRELDALTEAMGETGIKNGMILTTDRDVEIKTSHGVISVVNITRWLLET